MLVKDGQIVANGLAEGFHGGASSGLYYKGKMVHSPGRLLSNALVVVYQPPIIENGRTLVPLRTIFKEIGAEIVWDNETKTVTARKGDSVIILQAESKTALFNDESVRLDVPARILNGRMLVPSRFVAESLGLKVDWSQENYSVIITTEIDKLT